MKIKVINNTGRNLGDKLVKEIYKVAYRLEADEVIVNKVKTNSYAEVQLNNTFYNGCVDWNYGISV